MKIDVYNNNKSVKPTTSWKSLADMFNFLEENTEIKKVYVGQPVGEFAAVDGAKAVLFGGLKG